MDMDWLVMAYMSATFGIAFFAAPTVWGWINDGVHQVIDAVVTTVRRRP